MGVVTTVGRFFSSSGRIGPPRAGLVTAAGAAIAWATGPAFDHGYALAYTSCGALLGAVIAKLAAEWARRLHDTGLSGATGAGVAVGAGILLVWIGTSDLDLDCPWLYPALAIAAGILAAIALLRPGSKQRNRYGDPPTRPLDRGAGPVEGVRRGAAWALVSTLGGLMIGLFLISVSEGMRQENEETMRYLQQQEGKR